MIGRPPSGLYTHSVCPAFGPRTSRRQSSLSCPSRGSMELLCQLQGRCERPLRRRMKSRRSKATAGLRSIISSRLMSSSAFNACSAVSMAPPACCRTLAVTPSPTNPPSARFAVSNRVATALSFGASSGFVVWRCAIRRSTAGSASRAVATSSAIFSLRENSPASTLNVQLPFPFGAVSPPFASKRTAPFGTGRITLDGACAQMKRANDSPPTVATFEPLQFTRLASTLPHPAFAERISSVVASTRVPSLITNTGSHQMAWS